MSFYSLQFKDSTGKNIKMQEFKGKVILIVNTATKCGLSPQFRELEILHQKYKSQGFAIIGFPCNQFANQEPETNNSMVEACELNYGVTFLLSEKIFVNGENTHPVFNYLKANAQNSLFGKKIKWNFTKFLTSAHGKTVKRYAPIIKPSKIEKDIVILLNKEKK